jgi:hypothetical protein
VTVRVTPVVCVTDPLTPVIVIVYVLREVFEAVATVKVVDAPVAGFGLNAWVAPAGSPVAEKLTAPANPPVGAMFTV